LASKLAAKFRKANLNVRVNPKTGSIILGVGTRFLFEKNSARLSAQAKKTLQKIIPLYANTLLGDEQAAKNIASFNIIGHASPTFRGECVDPTQKNSQAYDYNLHLSALRAEAVTKYLFSSHSFSFNQKWVMRNLTNSVGKSFSEPVKFSKRFVASQHGRECYGYDVNNSQRVELSFTLKDNLKIHQ
jgi:flagellar motor protein MotB